jgi:hypothetical protein
MKTRVIHLQYSMMLGMVCAIALFFIRIPALAGIPDEIQVLNISAEDERAVIKTPDGNIQVIKAGDVLRDQQSVGQKNNEVRVVEITTGRVVLEDRTQTGSETVIIRLADGKQRIERIRKLPDNRPILFKPN